MSGTVYVAWEPLAGESIERAAIEAIGMASFSRSTIIVLFNGVYVRATADSNPADLVESYHTALRS